MQSVSYFISHISGHNWQEWQSPHKHGYLQIRQCALCGKTQQKFFMMHWLLRYKWTWVTIQAEKR